MAIYPCVSCRLRQRRWPAWLSATNRFHTFPVITTLIGTSLTSTSLLHTPPHPRIHYCRARLYSAAAISGFFLRSGALKMGRNYSGYLAVEGVLLLSRLACLNYDSSLGHYFASAACGLQNAMRGITTYSGAEFEPHTLPAFSPTLDS